MSKERIIKVENSLNELVLFEGGSMKFRGKFVSAKEIDGGVLVSFRDDEFDPQNSSDKGQLLNFDTSEFGPTPEDFDKAEKRGEPEETISDYIKQQIFIGDLLLHYHAYGEKGLEAFFTEGRELDSVEMNAQERNNSSTRLRLSPNKREKLNDRIVKAVRDFHYKGKGSLQEAFKSVSLQSKKLLGYTLTAKQVEGRWNRTKKSVGD